ncbi:MAG: lysylphosphatidylglycerol synthase transmembrane domain-containing protein [Bacteroidetes bacterium]|nr:lysylphosphatidylglycerol synthase transmembrane domain-containing protein [Bacteroidota bacterium]
MSNRTKIRKYYNYLIGAVILLVTWAFIYHKVSHQNNLTGAWQNFRALIERSGFQVEFLIAVLLVFLNWGIESFKWRLLISKVENITFLRSFQAVLTGVSVSTFTPNRIGEYFGRVFILQKAGRIEGILITILGSISQLLITILTGATCMLVFIPLHLGNSQHLTGYFYDALVVLVISIDIFLLYFYFNIAQFYTVIEKLFRKRWRSVHKFFRVLTLFSYKDLCNVISLSFFRYMVFSIQFYILLRMFSVPVSFFEGLVVIAIIFFIMTIIPTITLTELGIRGSVALFFFSFVFPKDESVSIGILSASVLLWAINLALPALIGSVFVFRLTFFRKNPNQINS